jgi:medium-chain acyl-[acyl-carrier-protein] hydrolase
LALAPGSGSVSAATVSKSALWFHVPRPVVRPRLRFFCFPHAGGSSIQFHKWGALVDSDIEVLAAQLPGRGRRLPEEPCRRMTQLAVSLADAIAPLTDIPYAVFGHSLGASAGFEVIRELRRRGAPLPLHFFASARPAPHLPQKYGAIHHLPQAAFFSALEERYGMADDALRDPELAALLYPSLKADFEILATWDYQPGEPIQVPLTALGALQDKHAERHELEAWREHTTGPFSIHMFPGGHFYWLTDPTPLLSRMRGALRGDL